MAGFKRIKRADGVVVVECRIQMRGAKPMRRRFDNLDHAKKWARITEAEITEGRLMHRKPGDRKTFREAAERYDKTEMVKKAPKTIESDASRLRWWVSRLGHRPLARITPAEISEALSNLSVEGPGDNKGGRATLKHGCSSSTRRRYRTLLHHLFELARREWGWIRENPVRQVAAPENRPGRIRFLTDDERGRLLEACRQVSEQLYRVVFLLLHTGARRGEILGLLWSDVDLQAGLIRLRAEGTKSRRPRGLPLVDDALEILRQIRSERAVVSQLVFPSARDPQHPVGSLKKSWATACRLAGIRDFRMHDCRHDFASRMLKGGASLAELAELLGHRDFQMVRRYAHLAPEHLHAVVRRVLGKGVR